MDLNEMKKLHQDAEFRYWTGKLSTLINKIVKEKLASSYDLELIATFKKEQQLEILEKIANHGWSFKQVLSWYNSY